MPAEVSALAGGVHQQIAGALVPVLAERRAPIPTIATRSRDAIAGHESLPLDWASSYKRCAIALGVPFGSAQRGKGLPAGRPSAHPDDARGRTRTTGEIVELGAAGQGRPPPEAPPSLRSEAWKFAFTGSRASVRHAANCRRSACA